MAISDNAVWLKQSQVDEHMSRDPSNLRDCFHTTEKCYENCGLNLLILETI